MNLRRSKYKIGDTVGRLTVIEYAGKTERNCHLWKCQCMCGNTKVVRANQLGVSVSSCGCLKSERTSARCFKGVGELYSSFWKNIVVGARVRNLEFTITINDAWDLFLKQNRRCAITGELLMLGPRWKDKNQITASLDRIDSSKGYTLENIQWIHKDINKMKMEFPQEKFILWCKKVAEHQQTTSKP